MNKNFAAALAAFLCLARPAHAIDSVSVELGRGHGVDLWRAGAQWKWRGSSSYWELSAGAWDGGLQTVYDVGFTPVLRFERANGSRPYVEGAIGVHLLSRLEITPARSFSTRLQFGDHIGAGFRFGPAQRYDLGLRLQHISNAGIRNPNPGVNFLQLRLQVNLD